MAYAIGDFNDDGKPDVAISYWVGVAVFLGNGDGTLQAPKTTNLTGQVPGYSLVAGDFNGHGKLDVAYGGYAGNYLTIVLGNGDGTFQTPPATLTTDGYGGNIVLAGPNGDGRPDLVSANSSGNTIDVFLNATYAALNIALSHTGKFTIGQTGSYQITISNPEFASTSGTVTVTDTLPAGLKASAISGSGWSCGLNPLACNRSDALALTPVTRRSRSP